MQFLLAFTFLRVPCSRGSLVRRVLRSSRFSSHREETRAGTLAHSVAAAETDTSQPQD